ncbi:alpha-methylacyl-CoA racemase [Tamaricihabitans halophyticus]|uniref:Alpha-methylacyl-CoA racemase n=1 Tax=Tamaricihabitans halophyticus TaxID=1262583 RepID=A0A4R2QDW8_9PSEU|nr:alpha-methylacyl-CoA racemase [Tamaricihabitans halophyticus]
MRIVEIAGIGPGPFAGMALADLGADVIRIDRPSGAEPPVPAERDILNRGRPSVVVDLQDSRGVALLLKLVERADILTEGFRPGVAERLGFGPDRCMERNPSLVYGRVTGWGQDGPLASTAGHDINYIALSGVLDAIGRDGGPPQIPLNVIGDFAGGGLYLVMGVLAALTHARATGEGQVVDAAISDGVAHLLAMTTSLWNNGMWSGERGTNILDSGAPFYDVYATADGRYMAVGAFERRFYTVLTNTLGIEENIDHYNRDNWPMLRTKMAERFAQRTQAEWCDIFSGTDACVTPVVPFAEAATYGHNARRQTYVKRWGMTQPAPAPRFSRTPSSLTTPPAKPGSQTAETLAAWGVSDIDELLERGIVGNATELPVDGATDFTENVGIKRNVGDAANTGF